MKLRSASLYYAIIVALIIALTCSAFISFIYFQLYEEQYYDLHNRLVSEVYSGIELSKSNSFQTGESARWQFSSVHNDSIEIKKIKWGIYDVVYCKAYFKKNHFEKSMLLGSKEKQQYSKIALYISNQQKAINIAGSIKIRGDVYLASNGFKRNYIDIRTPIATDYLKGNILLSNNALYSIDQTEFNNIIRQKNINSNDSIVESTYLLNHSIYQSFSNNTIVIKSENDIHLSNIALQGNIKIICSKTVIIDKNTNIKDICIIAKHVIIRKDAELNAQFMISDSMRLEEHVTLNYPSSILLLDENSISISSRKLTIAKNCNIKGEIYFLNTHKKLTNESYCLIEEGSKIEGLLYSDVNTSIYGEVYGTAFIDKPIVILNGAYYENQLLNATFDKSKLNTSFLWSPLLQSNTEKTTLKCLD